MLLVPIDTPKLIDIQEVYLPEEATIQVNISPHPFTDEIKTFFVAPGITLQEILYEYANSSLGGTIHIFVDGWHAPKDMWASIRPKPNTSVDVNVTPKGGDSSKVFRTLAIVAITAAAITAAFYLSPILGPLAANLVGAGIMMGGMFLVDTFLPPPVPKRNQIDGTGSSSSTLFIEGGSNESRWYREIPIVLGKYRVTPPYGAVPFTEVRGSDQYLRLLFVWSYGPITLEDLRIGETPLDNFEGVEHDFRRGYTSDMLNDQGNWDASSGAYPISGVFGDRYTISVAGTIDSVDYLVDDTIILWDPTNITSSAAWDRNHDKPITLYTNDTYPLGLQITLEPLGDWVVRRTEQAADEITFSLTFPTGLIWIQDDGDRKSVTIETEIEYSIADADDWQPVTVLATTGQQTAALRNSHTWATGNRVFYDVRTRNLTSGKAGDGYLAECTWTGLTAVIYQEPIRLKGLALSALVIKATNQLQRVVSEFNGVVQTIAQDYDTNTLSWLMRPTSNNASLYRLVLKSRANKLALLDSRIDIDQLVEWHTFCTENNLDFNHVVDYPTSVGEVIKLITTTGRASPYNNSGKFSVTIDKPQTLYAQHINPSNSWGYSGKKTFITVPHALRIPFNNREDNWASDEVIVYRDGYNEDNATLFETLDILGVTNSDLGYKLGRYYLAQILLRPEEHSVYMNFEYILARRGSLVAFSHFAISVGLGSGRILSVQNDYDTNTVTSILLQNDVDMQLGVIYGLSIRTENNAKFSIQIVTDPGTQQQVVPTQTLAIGTIKEGDLYTFGEFGNETMPALVKSIEPQSHETALVKLVPYDDAVYSADTEEIPPFNSYITSSVAQGYPSTTQIRSDEAALRRLPGGVLIQRIMIAYEFASRRTNTITGLEVQYKQADTDGTWLSQINSADADIVYLTEVVIGQQYLIRSRFILTNGVGPWGPTLAHTVVGPVNAPPDIESLLIEGGILRWAYANPPLDFDGFEVKAHEGQLLTWATAAPLHTGRIKETRFDVSSYTQVTRTFLVAAFDIYNNMSGVASVVVNLPSSVPSNILETEDHRALGWPGTIVNGTVTGGDLAADGDGTPFWTGDNNPFWTNDADPFWTGQYKAMSYTVTYIPDSAYLDTTLTIGVVATGGSWRVLYRKVGDTTFISWPGIVQNLYASGYEFRVEFDAGSQGGVLEEFKINLDVPDQTEFFEDLSIASGGTRPTITRSFRSIKGISYNLQEDAGSAVVIKLSDKTVSPGPLLVAYDKDGNYTTATIDVTVFGIRGTS